MNSFMNSSSGSRTFSTVCVVRKPSCTLKNGVCEASAARRQIRHRSPASWALRPNSMPQPQSATLITSSCPAWTFSEWLVKRPGADVHHDRQPLAGNRVEHFLHQDEALAGREIRHASAGGGKAFAERRGRVLAFRLDEDQQIAPQVFVAVHHGRVVAAAHRRRAGDGKRARRLRDIDLDMHDRFRAVAGRRNAGILELALFATRHHIGRIVANIAYGGAAFGDQAFSH